MDKLDLVNNFNIIIFFFIYKTELFYIYQNNNLKKQILKAKHIQCLEMIEKIF